MNNELISQEELYSLVEEWISELLDSKWINDPAYLGGWYDGYSSSEYKYFYFYLYDLDGCLGRVGDSCLEDNDHWEICNDWYDEKREYIKIYNDHIEIDEDSEFSDFIEDDICSLYTFLKERIFDIEEENKNE